MDWYKTLILINFGLSIINCSNFPLRKYFHITSQKNWTDAQLYCREKHTDLVTLESIEDMIELETFENLGAVWIGLHDDPASWKGTLGNDSNSWRWSTTGQISTSQYHNWMNSEPNFSNGNEKCVVMTTDGQWKDMKCALLTSFLCYTDIGPNQKTYVFVATTKTWSDAQTYCRQHYTDLATISNSEENTRVQSLIPAATLPWIGLYRVPWAWSDKSSSTFRAWTGSQPDNKNLAQHCAYINTCKMYDRECDDPKTFICSEVTKSKNRIRLMMKTTTTLSDPAVYEKMIQKILSAFRSQGWTDLKMPWTTTPRNPPETNYANGSVYKC